jgi:hypothetical protein
LGEAAALGRAVELVVHDGQVNGRFAPLADGGPSSIQACGNSQLAGKDVDCAERQDAEAGTVKSVRHVAEAVEDFVEGAVAAGGHDGFEAFADGFGSEPAGIAGGGGRFERTLASDGIQVLPKPPRFIAAGRWIEDHAGAHAPCLGGGLGGVEEKHLRRET